VPLAVIAVARTGFDSRVSHLCGRSQILMSLTVVEPNMAFHLPAGSPSLRWEEKNTLRAIIRDGFCLESFQASYSFSAAKMSNQKMPLAAKVLNRKKWLILGSFRMFPFKLHSNDVHVICPKNKPFFAETLKAETAVAEPPKAVSAKPTFLHYLLLCPSYVYSPIIW